MSDKETRTAVLEAAVATAYLVRGGELDRDTAGRDLLREALAAGLGEPEARRLIGLGFSRDPGPSAPDKPIDWAAVAGASRAVQPPPDDNTPPAHPDDPGPAACVEAVGADDSWHSLVVRDSKMRPKGVLANAMVYLEHHEDLRDRLGFNERSLEVCWRRPPPWEVQPRVATDTDAAELSQWLAEHVRVAFPSGPLWEAICAEAHRHPFEPVADWLASLEWDGVSRAAQWLPLCLGAAPTPFVATIGRKWLISAVARVFEPGCKVDHMLVLEGCQGLGKSECLSLLARPWHVELTLDPASKDTLQDIHGPWVIEWGELAGMNKKESEAVKGFLTRREDRFRPSYGRSSQTFRRRCVFAASTNDRSYIADTTGGRRFWPVTVTRYDLAWLELCRKQLWAEAVARYRKGEQWWLDGDETIMATAEQDLRYQGEPWELPIAEHLRIGRLSSEEYVTCNMILDVLDVPKERQNTGSARTVAKVMERLGWERGRRQIQGRDVRVYLRPDLDHRIRPATEALSGGSDRYRKQGDLIPFRGQRPDEGAKAR